MKSSVGPKRSEKDILASCLRYLKARGIFAMRMNTGAMKVGSRFVKFGVSGCSDILAITRTSATQFTEHVPIWIECKREGGKQSPAQKAFAQSVQMYGMRYVVVHSAAELSLIL